MATDRTNSFKTIQFTTFKKLSITFSARLLDATATPKCLSRVCYSEGQQTNLDHQGFFEICRILRHLNVGMHRILPERGTIVPRLFKEGARKLEHPAY